MQEAEAAVAACYRVFGRYRFDGGCLEAADGIGPLEKRLLRVLPPAEIPPVLLMAYMASLPLAISGPVADDVRALLPRLFELAADGAVPRAAAADVLARADVHAHWPDDEAAAVDRMLACLARAASEPPDGAAG